MSESFTVDVPVRFRDLDPLNHVNHAVYASYLESARMEYFEAVLAEYYEQSSFVVATLEISYRKPIVQDDEPTVSLTVTDVGESSFTMSYEITVEGETVSTAETVLVHIDPATERPTALPDAVRTRLRGDDPLEAAA